MKNILIRRNREVKYLTMEKAMKTLKNALGLKAYMMREKEEKKKTLR